MPEKMVNKSGIPEIFFKAAQIDRHITAGDISVTQLIDAPQIRYLRKTEEIEVDIKDKLWMLFGTAVHHILERAEVDSFSARYLIDAAQVLDDMDEEKNKSAAQYLRDLAREKFPKAFDDSLMIESTLSLDFPVSNDVITISGTIDKFEKKTGILKDYKTASVYQYMYEESRNKWYSQQNVYAYMLRELGHEVKGIKIVALFKDWKKHGMMRSKNYPPSLAMEIDVPMIEHSVVGEYIKRRLEMHLEVFAKNGEVLCNGTDRWASADMFKVKKKGGLRAIRNFDKQSLAVRFMEDNQIKYGNKLSIEYTPGENRRCNEFCPVREVCPQKRENDAKLEQLNNGK